ncbi:MAG: TIGR04283 family arsenosugar biosynthesis glycosyltransferase [Rhodothermales bacterium]
MDSASSYVLPRDELLRLSVIIPTYNEAEHIGTLVRYLRQHGGEMVAEILVVDGHSTDATRTHAANAGATVLQALERGRAAQMNHGAHHATGNVLYFVHADTRPPERFVAHIRDALADSFPMGCFRFVFDRPHPLLRLNAYFTRFDRLMCRGGDQTLFVTRALFDATDGYDPTFVIMEEYDWLRRARRLALFTIMPDDTTVSARKYRKRSYLRVNLANLAVFTLFYCGACPKRIRKLYGTLLGS